MTTKNAFNNKKILITGASGFIGHSLATSLATVDCEIIRCSRMPNKLLPLTGPAAIADRAVDYSDSSIWSELLAGVDYVFLLGAQTSAYDAADDPNRDFRQNVLPLLCLLEHCRSSAIEPVLVFASTATVVGMTDQLPVAEGIFENPVTVYDIHKLSCEKYLSYYARNGFVRACSLRLANVYGPGTSSSSMDRGILNLMIRRAIRRESLSIFGEGLQLRDYTYIDDVVSAFEAAAAHIDRTNGCYFNIGSGQGHNFIQAFETIADCVKSKLGHDINIEHIASPADLALIESRSYVANTASFTKETGWTPKTDLKTGIEQTLERFAE